LDLNGDTYYDVLALHVDVPVSERGDYIARIRLESPDAVNSPCFDYGRPAGMVGPLSAIPDLTGHADSTNVCRFDVWFDGEIVRQCAGPLAARLCVFSTDASETSLQPVGEFRVPIEIAEKKERFGWQAIHILGIAWQPGVSQTENLPVRVDVARAGTFVVQVWVYEDQEEISFQAFEESLRPGEIEVQIPWKPGIRADGLEIVFSTAWQPPWGETHERWTLPQGTEQ